MFCCKPLISNSGIWLSWKKSVEKSRLAVCLLISGSQVRALVRPPPSLAKPERSGTHTRRLFFAAVFAIVEDGLPSPSAFSRLQGAFGRTVSVEKNAVPQGRSAGAVGEAQKRRFARGG